MKKSDDIRNILNIIRSNTLITEEKNEDTLKITKSTPQFSDLRLDQEEQLKKTIGENIELDDNSLIFYRKNKDLILNGKIPSLNLIFQFRFNDPSGEGCYLWINGLQLTDNNNRTIGKIKDAFSNWRQNLIENDDIINDLIKYMDHQL